MSITKIIDCSKYDCVLKKLIAQSKKLQLPQSCQEKLAGLESDVVQLSQTSLARNNIGKVYKKTF